MEEKKLTPMRFRPERVERKWGIAEYRIADLGYIDSVALDGWLSGNSISDIMQTYLERFTGEVPFEYYGIKGRTSLHVNPDDESAEQRYDAFGKTALWYVAEAGADAKLFLGFKREVTAEEFWRKCQDGTVEDLLNVVKPRVGEHYLVTPGMVHAAQDVRLLEVAESSELWFRLHAWDDPEAELHLEEAFDLIDFKPYRVAAAKGDPEAVTEKIAVTPQLREFPALRLRERRGLAGGGGDDTASFPCRRSHRGSGRNPATYPHARGARDTPSGGDARAPERKGRIHRPERRTLPEGGGLRRPRGRGTPGS